MNKQIETKILDAARKEFSEKGLKKASVTHIASEAGISIGTLYAYFTSKELLFKAIGQPELKEYNPEEEKRKEKIQKAALKIFAANGYEATTMDAVAKECGFAKAVLYRYFKNKEELYIALFYAPHFMGTLENLQTIDSGSDLKKTLKNMGTLFLKLFENPDRRNILKMIISEAGRHPEIQKLMYENTIEKVGGYMVTYLEGLEARGVITKMDYKLAARSYFGQLYSFVLIDKIMHPGDAGYSDEQIIDFAAEVFEKGLKR